MASDNTLVQYWSKNLREAATTGTGWSGWWPGPARVFAATAHFHDPCYAAEWSVPAFAAVCALVLAGLRA